MSALNRRPLAQLLPGDVVIDEHHDKHGNRRVVIAPGIDCVVVSISHSDGRRFSATIPCRRLDGSGAGT